MVDKEIIGRIHELIKENKVVFDFDAEKDILKQGYNWTKEFIIKCLEEGKIYSGPELYPIIPERKERHYCIHKPHTFSSKLILIGFLILEDLLIIHIAPCNKHSKEGKIYYNL